MTKSRMKLLLLAGASAMALGATPAAAVAVFSFTGGIVLWSAPTAGIYQIDAYGAQGGGGSGGKSGTIGGSGAAVGGRFTLTTGESLQIAVGGQGEKFG